MDRAGTSELSTTSGDAPGELALPVQGPLPRWPFILTGVLLALGIALAVTWPINLPYIAFAPGSVLDLDDFVMVPDSVTGDSEGDLFFLTVSTDDVNVVEWLGAQFDPSVDLVRREAVRPPDEPPEVYRLRQLNLMEDSKNAAIWVALTRLGYEPESRGALVVGLTEESPAEGLLDAGDIIVEVGSEEITTTAELIEMIGERDPGDELSLVVLRPDGESEEADRVDLTTTLGPHPDDANRAAIGILVRDEVEFPIDVEIDSQNIVGPSAGMMFTLEIMDLLTEDDLTSGRRITGTGTIDRNGNVGPIGGIRQKVYGSIDAGAEYMLVPSANFDEALVAAGDDIELIRVDTVDEALAFLDTLG